METLLGPRSLGEESLQMWDLNKRLEAYLARVKYLEEENEVLRAEIQTLRGAPQESAWKGKYEGQVAALRATLDQAFREKCAAELARDSLQEEVQQVKRQCRKERSAQEEAHRLLSLSKKEAEEERRAQLWLREKAAQLEKEAQALALAHQEEVASLDQEVAGLSRSLEGSRAAPLPAVGFQPVEVEDYAQRLSGLWKGAVETYKAEVSQLEASLGQAKESLWKATEGNRQNQLQLQQLEKELAGLALQKELLEESLAQQWQHQHGEAEKLQVAIESLEEEKRSLRVQIAQVLEDRQQLMHLKMSLSLEVATYRTLLEAESTRLQLPGADFKIPGALRGSKWEARSRQLPGVSLEEGRLGSWDLKLSPTHGTKRNGTPRLLRSPAESLATSFVSPRPKSCRSPPTAAGAREFQKASHVLLLQAAKDDRDVALVQKEAPESTETSAIQLGFSERSTLAMSTKTEMVSWAVSYDTPLGRNTVSLRVADEEESEERGQKEGGGKEDGAATPTEAEGTWEKEEPHEEEAEEAEEEEEEEEEDEKQPNEEPPGEDSLRNMLCPPQLLTEVLEMAVQEVNGEGPCLEPCSLKASGGPSAPHPPDPSLPTGEANGEALSPGQEVLEEEEAGLEVEGDPKREEPPEVVQGSRHTTELNGGREAYSELQEEEEEEEAGGAAAGGEGPWVSQDAESSSPLQTEAPKEEQNREQRPAGVLLAAPGETEFGQDAESSPQAGQAGPEDPPGPLSTEQRDGPGEETDQGTGHPCDLEDDPGTEESWPRSPSPSPLGATGRSLEEVDGGAEDLEEVESPEALPLTAGEGRRALWSPSREEKEEEEEEEEEVVLAEMLGDGFLEEGGLAVDGLAPRSPTTFLVPSGPEHLHLPVELEPFQAPGALLCESGWASAEPLGPEALCLEEVLAREEDFSAARSEEKAPAGEARVAGGREAEEGESEAKASEETPGDKEGDEEEKNAGDAGAGEARGNFSDTATVGPKTLPKREDCLGNEAATEQEGFPAPDNAGPKDLQEENTLGNEDLLEQEGLSDVKNTGHEGENEDVTPAESFPDMENMGCKDLHEEANHVGTGDRVEQEGFPGMENFGPKVIQEEEKDWERGDAIDGESFSAEESSSKHKALHEEEDEMGNGVTGEQEDLSVADNIGAEGLPKEASVLGNEDTPERAGFSDVGGIERKDLRTEENAAENEGTEEQDMEMTTGSHEAVCLPDIAWAEENILRAEMLDGEQAEENSSRPAELLPTEQKMEKEDDSPEVSPVAEGDAPVGGDWETGTEAIEVEKDEAGGLLETEDTAGHLRTNHRKVDENPPQSSEGQEGRTGTLAAEEQPMATEGQLASQGQHATHIGQAPACEIQEEPPAPAEMPSGMADGRGAKDRSDPGSLQSQRDSSGSEDSLESWGTSPNTTCERDALGKEATLEETLPGLTPFHVDDEQRPAATGACPWPSESEEATEFLPETTGSAAPLEGAPHVLEGGSQGSPQLQGSSREGENTGEQSGHPTEATPSQHIPGSPELPAASKDLEVVPNETSESEDSHPGEASGRREFLGQDPELSVEESDRQPEEETSQPGSDTAGEQKPTTTQTYEGESRTDLAGEAEKGGIVPGDDLWAPNNLQQTAHKEEGGSLELSEESITEEVSQVSPLTSVADLGEIVLEGGDAPASGQRGAAEPKVLTGCQEGFQHTSPPDHTPEEALSETGPSSSKDSPCASAEAAVSVSAEGMKDSDILEIVEQALEFNQELIRAAEERAEAELSALGGGGVSDLPEGQGHVASTPSWETGEPQATGDVAKVSPGSAKDPTETPGPWVASDTNGLPQEPGLPEIATVLELNGLSHLPRSHGEEDGSDHDDDGGTSAGEFVKKDAIPQGSPREEVQGLPTLQSGSHGPPQGPANEEAKRWAGQDVLLIPEGGSPGNKTEPAALGLKGGLSADLMQAACLKGGKGPEMGALPILPAFEEEALRLESGQHLKFRPEAEEELWSQEDP